MTFIKAHRERTKKYAELADPNHIAQWLLECGYYPEQNILPPCFQVSEFKLKESAIIDVSTLDKRDKAELINVVYPKNKIHDRTFSIQHPKYYHDLVYHISKNWNFVREFLFDEENKIYSYSLPIPINALSANLGIPLRSGRMIYEWLEMAEEDLVADAYEYDYLVKTDVTNFYKSIYTHSISWALHTREKSLEDLSANVGDRYQLVGNKIDRLMQYANDRKSNSIPIGSSLSDLVAEIILSDIDTKVSMKLKKEKIDFLATRFKDDYRFLCKNEEKSKQIIRILSEELDKYNLLISVDKTNLFRLPNGLYRDHIREYQLLALRRKELDFKSFEYTLLNTLDIHRKYPGTSILEKFLSDIVDSNHKLKVTVREKKDVLKMLSLLVFITKESPKTLCHVLAIIELLYLKFKKVKDITDKIKHIVGIEIEKSIEENSAFSFIWYVFFSKYLGLNVRYTIDKNSELYRNLLVQSIDQSKQLFFTDYNEGKFFVNPKKAVKQNLAKTLDVFYRPMQ